MSAAIILDKNLKKSGEAQLPESYKDINSHNLYLYIKSFLASMRANNAIAKHAVELAAVVKSLGIKRVAVEQEQEVSLLLCL